MTAHGNFQRPLTSKGFVAVKGTPRPPALAGAVLWGGMGALTAQGEHRAGGCCRGAAAARGGGERGWDARVSPVACRLSGGTSPLPAAVYSPCPSVPGWREARCLSFYLCSLFPASFHARPKRFQPSAAGGFPMCTRFFGEGLRKEPGV